MGQSPDPALAALLERAAQEGAAALHRQLVAEGRLPPAKAPPLAAAPAERTVGEFWQEYLASLVPGSHYKKNRVSQGRHILTPFKHRGETMVLADLRPSQCTHQVLVSWQTMLSQLENQYHPGRRLSAGSVDQIRMSVQCMWKHFRELEELDTNPWTKVDRLEGWDKQRVGYFTPEEAAAYAAAFPHPGNFIIRHMFYTCCRKGSIQKLRKHDIDFNNGTLLMKLKGKRRDQAHPIPVPDDILEEMKSLCKLSPSEWVYPSPRNPQRYVPDGTLDNWAQRAQEKTGLAPLGEKGVPHMLRHGGAVDMIEHGADITEVQYQLTHSSITTTARYAKMRSRMLDRARKRQNERLAPKAK